MAVTEIGDPRLQALFGANDPRETGARPTVRLPRKGLPPLAIAACALLIGLLLFLVLNGRRTRQAEPTVRASVRAGDTAWQPPPALYVPPAAQPVPLPAFQTDRIPKSQSVAAPVPAVTAGPQQRMGYMPQPVPQLAPPFPPQARRPPSAEAPLVIDSGNAATPAAPAASAGQGTFSAFAPFGQVAAWTRASARANRATTVPQGTLIPAVLETAFNSTQPGFARAVVSRDVRSFDGKKVLIPRGSRLVGEYRSDVGQGQKRAIIIWSRLIRPDGMTISVDSPAVDTLGRGGVEASVNTHFLQRLGDALLQTTMGLGSAVAQRAVQGPVILVPGAAGQTTAQTAAGSYVPTLTIPPGRSISVFVARDLDFSAAGPSQ